MAGRPKQKKANIEALKKLATAQSIVDLHPLIAYIMRECGCTYSEIASALEVTRQRAETRYRQAERIYVK